LRTPIVLLPGLDGTGVLFRRFLAAAPECFAPVVVPLPQDGPQEYAALAERLLPAFRSAVRHAAADDGRSAVVLGESFAGPLALALAVRAAELVRAVVLCVSFVQPPAWRELRRLCRPWLFRLHPPALGLRLVLAGLRAPADLLADVREARRLSSPEATARRLRTALSADARPDLRSCRAPVLVLAGRRDHLVPRRAARAIVAARPEVECVFLDGPHLLLQSVPSDCWSAIERFVDRATLAG
jgi:pimeloyl-ACP methyl ester carboxylesterase